MGNKLIGSVGIFVYEYVITQQITDLCMSYINKNADVHLFICNPKNNKISNVELLNHPKIKTHLIISRSFLEKFYSFSFLRSIAPAIYRPPLISKQSISKLTKILGALTLDILIGVEKQGLIWLCESTKEISAPKFYYSLELYLEDYGPVLNDFYFHRGSEARLKERTFTKKITGIIIQDESRAGAFKEYNDNYN